MTVAKPCPVGARGVDSLPFSQGGSAAEATALRAAGIDFVALYLGVAGREQLNAVLSAGLMAFGVTTAGTYDGVRSALQAKALGLPSGVTLFLDLEGSAAYTTPVDQLLAKINAWADAVRLAGYVPGIYVGSPQPLTSDELTRLHVVRYWRAPARVVDRFGHLAEPIPGWCMYQMSPETTWAGVFVDVDIVGQDFRGRVPEMCAA